MTRAISDGLTSQAFSAEYITNILETRARALPEPGALQLARRHDLLDIDIAPPTSASTREIVMIPSELTGLDVVQLHRLQLHHIQSHYRAWALANKAAEQQHSHMDYLAQLIEAEVAMRENRSIERRIKNARAA